jgi:hypothetical protein
MQPSGFNKLAIQYAPQIVTQGAVSSVASESVDLYTVLRVGGYGSSSKPGKPKAALTSGD